MTNEELIATIRNEIERRIKDNTFGAKLELIDILAWLDTLESEKPMQEGLEEEIDRFEDWMETYNQADYPTSFTTRDIARHFAEWGAKHAKEQMMKEAVEGEIQMRYSGCLCAKTIRAINEDKFKLGDKVRVIIIPKED